MATFRALLFLLVLGYTSLLITCSQQADEFAEFDRDPDTDDESAVEVNKEDENLQQDSQDLFDEEEINDKPVESSKENMGEEMEEEDDDQQEQDEFDPYSDEEEFEGYTKDKSSKTKLPSSGLKITKVPVHLRAGWQSFYMELLTLLGILVYAANFFTGKTKNSKLATSWFKAHKPLLEQHFSIVGDDGMSKEPQSGVLVKESESVYTLWCTGRQYCEGMLVELRLLKRHDLVSVMSQLLRPKSEIIKITIYMDEEMDNFVFALFPRKQATKYQKELQDLSLFCGEKKSADKYGLPTYSILTESGEVSDFVLSSQICNIIKKYEDCFESMHFSDQFVGPKKDEGDDEGTTKVKKPKKVLLFEFKIPGNGYTKASDMGATEQLVKMVLHLVDRVKNFKLSQNARTKSEKKRREVAQSFLKSTHIQRQEAAQAKREEKARLEKEKLMAEEDPDKQRRMEDALSKKNAKRNGPKTKSLKVRM